jgi:hypothetical protein
MKGNFQIVLFSIEHSEIIYQCTITQLPILGDMIELQKGLTLFQIEGTFLSPSLKEDYSVYLLYGNIIGRTTNKIQFDDIRMGLIDTNIDIEANSYGQVLFPA